MQRFDADYVPRSAMTIFAHPDDAEFLVSGTIARWTQAGCEVTFVVITSGNVGTHDETTTRDALARTREAEQQEAARALGVKKVVFLGYDDCELVPSLGLRRRLVREIRAHRPEVVICGDPHALFFDLRPRVGLFKVAGMIGPGEEQPHPLAVWLCRHATLDGAIPRRRPTASR